jgi:DNA-binding response OmpR family regulator
MAVFNGTTKSSAIFAQSFCEKGPYLLDRQRRRGYFNGKPLQLSPINFDYLWLLLSSAPDPVSYERLVTESTGRRVAPTDPREATRWRIQQLRQVIEDNPGRPSRILAVPGYGYRLHL